MAALEKSGSRIYRANQNISRINDEQKRLDDELTNKQTTDKRAWEIRRRQLQLSADLQNAMIELTQARITLGTLYRQKIQIKVVVIPMNNDTNS